MKSAHSAETPKGTWTGMVSIFYANSFSEVACQGTYPNKSSKMETPMAQISEAAEYLFYFSA